ncbi:TIGR00730 family Rossman fold protein [Ideonella sp. B7]|uniref:LOG family protein n=1 Tax=Ideonella benzenivorans TaxID=2831643 RepID=UPI001CEDA5E6|nr:TIGR00730 family Rossman fold protein [Ideonella benzenivorans]MCA6217616.1 TIGR00730 family Rossman fold protein [Ideonella benzenivorans]
MSQRPFSVCVYCGSRPGSQALYAESAARLGQEIARRGWRLVYGGGHVGLMGIVADAALSAGAPVIGIIPERLQSREVGHRGLTELVVVSNMHQRKQRMAEEADAFLSMPGGLGTFEELFEVWTWHHLGYHSKPIGLLNVAGFYQPLLDYMGFAHEQGFVDASQQQALTVDEVPGRLLDRLAARAGHKALNASPTDYSAI